MAAVAVEAAVVGACATGPFDLSAQGSSGAMEPNSRAARGDLAFLRDGADRLTTEIHTADQFGVARIQERNEVPNAGADLSLELGIVFGDVHDVQVMAGWMF